MPVRVRVEVRHMILSGSQRSIFYGGQTKTGHAVLVSATKRLLRVLLPCLVVLLYPLAVFAQQTYTVNIDTSALAGKPGAVVFDFAHTNSSDNTATITNFLNGNGTAVPVMNESIGTGDGSTTGFNHSTVNTPVAPSTMTVNYTVMGTPLTAVDDGGGDLFGTSDGTLGSIDYRTGAIS